MADTDSRYKPISAVDAVVVTRDRPRLLKRLIISLNEITAPSGGGILVVDDSPDTHSIASNRDAIGYSKHHQLLHVSRLTWPSVRAALGLVYGKKVADFLSCLSLGRAYWNTSDARNIGQAVSLAINKGHPVLHLDDDAVLSKLSFLDICAHLTLFKVSGLPDYARLRWLLWFFAIHSSDFTERCARSGIWREVSVSSSRERHEKLLSVFTDLSIPNRIPSAEIDLLSFVDELPGQIGTGIAYLTNRITTPTPFFFPFPQEDQVWVRQIIRGGIEARTASYPVNHLPDRKKILDLDLLLREENGYAASAALQLESSGYSLRQCLTGILRSRSARIGLWQRILEQTKMDVAIEDVRTASLSLLARIKNHVEDVATERMLRTALEDHRSRDRQWQEIYVDLSRSAPHTFLRLLDRDALVN